MAAPGLGQQIALAEHRQVERMMEPVEHMIEPVEHRLAVHTIELELLLAYMVELEVGILYFLLDNSNLEFAEVVSRLEALLA